jgi:hypothetical protein
MGESGYVASDMVSTPTGEEMTSYKAMCHAWDELWRLRKRGVCVRTEVLYELTNAIGEAEAANEQPANSQT